LPGFDCIIFANLFGAKHYFGIMLQAFKIGDKVSITHTVTEKDIAQFQGNAVHEVYATFSIAREAEWAGRQFVLKMKEEGEEGIGTSAHVVHKAPAFVGEEVIFESTLEEVIGNNVICSFIATVESRIVATGSTGQKILSREKLNKHFDSFR
jgi:predicted thioesterase